MGVNKEHSNESALKVNAGIEQPKSVNPAMAEGIQRFRKRTTVVNDIYDGLRSGNRNMLGQAITLIESAREADKNQAAELISKCLPHSGNSVRIGVTGVPGVGKSTFIESFGLFLIEQGKRVAVLAIDPSSTRTKGSILGDKTRMEVLSVHPQAFIRPSASAGTLGGVARATREAMLLCETAGYDVILIETVGVGQSETAVAQMVDFFMLLMLAGGGDELQGIKRGIMEMADLIVINKADGDNIHRAEIAKREYENALHLFPPLENGWVPQTLTASAINSNGILEVWNQIVEFIKLTRGNGSFLAKRKQQALTIMSEALEKELKAHFYADSLLSQQLQLMESKILDNHISPYQAAQILLNDYYQRLKVTDSE